MASSSFTFTPAQLGGGRDKTQLIAYADRFGGSLAELSQLLRDDLDGVFDGVHILPFFTPFDGADAGFDPADHTQVDERLGSWRDVKELSRTHHVMADMIVNHVSHTNPAFRDVVENGEDSEYADMFLTFSAVFPDGASEEELATIYRPRPGMPFTHYRWGDKTRLVWTTFTPQQIDINVATGAGRQYLENVLDALASGGVTQVRLDAVGYAVKTPGTSSFMTPQTYEFIDSLAERARERGMSVLVEIHSHYENQVEVAKRVDQVYDFALPPLLLHAIHSDDIAPLTKWLELRPLNAVTVLDTHDGIGIVDIGGDGAKPGLVTDEQLSALVESIHDASDGASRKATGWAASNVDIYQVNCTFVDACGSSKAYALARAVQVFTPGVAQVYYAGLLGAHCDLELLERTGVGRDINRPYFTAEQVRARLRDELVADQVELLRLRRTHPAFDGSCTITADPEAASLAIEWRQGEDVCTLTANFAEKSYAISHS
ncbi:sucrose phosphorylase [Nanchangia anserum]|uniref:sucrose phosphorylase n=1 Tax=Nanchangia anserum TaxID=2692125 RepID=UPI001D12B500|nr:sucrose phosphorylase [Nanchangia anserum]